MSSDEPKRAGWYGWATFGYANTDPSHVTTCGICGSSFAHGILPAGDSMNCPHCGAEAYATYDEGGNYMLEWYEGENWS